jgi:hypothetical protein
MPPIDFRGYSGDCLIHGRLAIPAEVRLTDFLNSSLVFGVRDMSLYALEEGQPVVAGDRDLSANELWAVEPTDTGKTPWHADLRIATRAIRIEVEMAPYRVVGTLHALGSERPLGARNRRRRRMVPLTDAEITFTYVGHEMIRKTPVVIINRDRIVRIRRMNNVRYGSSSPVGELSTS